MEISVKRITPKTKERIANFIKKIEKTSYFYDMSIYLSQITKTKDHINYTLAGYDICIGESKYTDFAGYNEVVRVKSVEFFGDNETYFFKPGTCEILDVNDVVKIIFDFLNENL